MKRITVVVPCYNEEENVDDVYNELTAVFKTIPNYRFEILFIDNASTDKTVTLIKKLAAADPNVKLIVNSRNFGPIRSTHHALLQATGDAVVLIFADLQEPPKHIADFVKRWEEGYPIVAGVKTTSDESWLFYTARSIYYDLLHRISEAEPIPHFCGYGLYDQRVIQELRMIDDPYPYFRGLISELGFTVARVEYTQRVRKKGKPKGDFYRLFEAGMLGLTSHSKVPLRLATLFGLALGLLSGLVGSVYLVAKLIYWNDFPLGIAPLIVGTYFFASVQLISIGLLGEYISAINIQVRKRPLVIEKERINFRAETPPPVLIHDLNEQTESHKPEVPTELLK